MSKSARERAREWLDGAARHSSELSVACELLRDLLAEADDFEQAARKAARGHAEMVAQLAAALAEADRLRGCQAQALIAQREAEGERKTRMAFRDDFNTVQRALADAQSDLDALRSRLERADELADAIETARRVSPTWAVRSADRLAIEAFLDAYRGGA